MSPGQRGFTGVLFCGPLELLGSELHPLALNSTQHAEMHEVVDREASLSGRRAQACLVVRDV